MQDAPRGKIRVLPAVRSFKGKSWQSVPHRALRDDPDSPARRTAIEAALHPWREELAGLPLYVSLDRDVLNADEAIVNWDSGKLLVAEVLAVIRTFLSAMTLRSRRRAICSMKFASPSGIAESHQKQHGTW